MKAVEGKFGRVFVLRMEHGDVLPGCIEDFAAQKGVQTGCVILVGGIASGEIVVGPRESDARPPEPMGHRLDEAHEIAAVGVLAPGEKGKPVLHIHGALGREGKTITGCLRKGAQTWVTGEVILYEITGTAACRIMDPDCGFALLEPLGRTAGGSQDAAPDGNGAAPGQQAAAHALRAGSQVNTDEGKRGAVAPAPEPQDRKTEDGATRVIYLFNAEMH